jgi:hypothetical protein
VKRRQFITVLGGAAAAWPLRGTCAAASIAGDWVFSKYFGFRNGISPSRLSFQGKPGRRSSMPTANEYRQQARECLELAKEAKDLYAKEAMAELAKEFSTAAKLLEQPASKH